jgi:hypothetical protein
MRPLPAACISVRGRVGTLLCARASVRLGTLQDAKS